MDWKTYFRIGLSGIRRHPGLTAGLYALGLAFSVAMLLPLGYALERATEYAALPLDLREVTAGMWWAVFKATAEGMGLTILLAFLLVPLHGLIRSIVLTGTAAALRPGDLSGFWAGVGRYGWRGLLVTLVFFGLGVMGLVGVLFASGLLALVFPGEVAVFWTQLVLAPVLAVAGLVVLDLMQDYARTAVVVDDASVGVAISAGMRFVRRHRAARRLYGVWFVLALGLWLLPFAIDAGLRSSIVGLFVLQQLALFARSATTIGWISSSVRLYSDVTDRERLWLAADESDEVAEPDAPLA